MNPDAPKNPQEKLEASLTSLLLGELPHEQAAALHEKLARDPELAGRYERLKETIGIVRETMHSPAEKTPDTAAPLKLSQERRQKLLAHFKTVAPKEFAEPKRPWRPTLLQMAVAASLVLIAGALLLPSLARSKSRGSYFGHGYAGTPADADTAKFAEHRALQRGQAELAENTSAKSVENHGNGGPSKVFSVDGVGYYNEASQSSGRVQNSGQLTPAAPILDFVPLQSARTTIALPQPEKPSDVAFSSAAGIAGNNTLSAGTPNSGKTGFDLLGPREVPSDSYLYNPHPPALLGMPAERNGVVVAADNARNPAVRGGASGGGGGGVGGSVQELSISSVGEGLRNSAGSDDRLRGAPQSAPLGEPIATNFVGDPEWIALLERPQQPHQQTNPYIARYAGLQRFSNSFDLNRNADEQGSVPSTALSQGIQTPLFGDISAPGNASSISAGLSFRLADGSKADVYSINGALAQMGKEGKEPAGRVTSPISLPTQTNLVLGQFDARTTPTFFATTDQSINASGAALQQDYSRSPATADYLTAERNLEELQRFRQILDMKIASEKIDIDLPKSLAVEIVDKAVPATNESSSLWDKIRGDNRDAFKSAARIKLERDQPDISGLADRGQIAGYDPYFIQMEFETIQSDALLGNVVKDLNLNEEWSKKQGGKPLTTEETVKLLKKQLDLRPVPNTSLIEVGVRSDKADEAARIANSVANNYQAHRAKQRNELSNGQIASLEGRLTEQEARIREAQQKVNEEAARAKLAQAPVADAAPPQPAAPPLIPQQEVQSADDAFSTFSLNVSDVSVKLAAASLEKGQMPEAGSVRSEEFINAFDYRDPEPPPGVAVGFAWERAQNPFAQNRDLLRFSIKTAALGREPGRPLNLVLLLDNSGSMERADRVRIIHEALGVLAGQLQAQDTLSIVTFARTARLWVDGAPGNQATQAVAQVSGLTPEGGTNLEEAMNLAYQTALRHYLANGVNRVVLLTDGAANLGDVEPATLRQKVEAHRKQGIALDCFGIGWEGYNDDLLEVLARNGDGRYGFINTPEEAATEFAGQLAGALRVAASDVKAQVEFNPARVTAWRQIGYAMHQLTKEQFRDNTVAAAQIGAAESGNALYAIQVNPAGEGPLVTVRVRYRVPGTADFREHEWTVPYTGNAAPLEQASTAMRLAATASAFSEWLAASPYAAEVSPDRLLGYLSGVPEQYGADARPKKLEWMIRQAKSLSGK